MASHFVKVALADGDQVVNTYENDDELTQAVANAVKDPRTMTLEIMTYDNEHLPLAQVTRLTRVNTEEEQGFQAVQGITLLPPDLCQMIVLYSIVHTLRMRLEQDQDSDAIPF